MKNAFVLVHHLGDNGTVDEGMILEGITEKRFDALEKKGLVREATAAEVKEGYKAPFIASGHIDAGEQAEKAKADPQNKKAADPANKGA
jgi:hypothetical protein